MARNALVGWANDLGSPTTIVMLRHGETTHTRERRFSGGTGRGGDPVLTARGERQAQRAAQHLARLSDDPGTHHASHPPIDVVLTSPMARTRQTAQAVGDALGLQPIVADGFTECDFGVWDGLTYGEVEQRWPGELAAWFGSTEVSPPEGHSFDHVQHRIAAALDQCRTDFAGKTVLVVTHVTPIKSTVRQVLDAPTSSLFRLELAPASFTSVAYFADGVASLRFVNDASHLRGLEA